MYENAASPLWFTVSASNTMNQVAAVGWAKVDRLRNSVPSNSTKGKELRVELETEGRALAVSCSRSLSAPEMSLHFEMAPEVSTMEAEWFASSQRKRLPRQTGEKRLE